jgi:hypothetical protein
MNANGVIRRLGAAVTLGLLFAGLAATGAAGATAQSCQNWGGQPPDQGTFANDLQGVAATSSCSAWAVGYYYNGSVDQTLIEHWNGHAWKIQPSPNPSSSGDNVLNGAAAISPTDVWAVGYYFNGTADQTLIEHWNGTVWQLERSPNLGTSTSFNELEGVAAVSADDAWAVGQGAGKALIEHWNGTAWKAQFTPRPALPGGRYLRRRPAIGLGGVAAISPSDAWAVGFHYNGTANQTLIEHWNGHAWKLAQSQNPGGNGNELDGVGATSSGDAWAVGSYYPGGMRPEQTLIEHWNGKAWSVSPSPSPGSGVNLLRGVAATSPSNAWAVGESGAQQQDPTLVEHWNGKAWKIQPSLSLGASGLTGIAATSASTAWAVGFYNTNGVDQALAIHCC